MTVSSYPVSTADHVLPPYANPNGISTLSTGTFSANNYSQAYVGGSRRSHCASKRSHCASKRCKICMKKHKFTVNFGKPKGKIQRRFCKSMRKSAKKIC